jgi:ABC-type amino acid transport substrate-binding protein
MTENMAKTVSHQAGNDEQRISDLCTEKFSDEEFTALLQNLLSHIYRLQNSALSTLDTHKKTKLEIQTREIALSENVSQIVSECRTCFSSTSQIQTRLSEATDAGLKLISDDLQNARNTLTQRQDGLRTTMVELSRIGRQLSMLAMNAKIEASRADRSESGFSVVADEVKRLAKAALQHHSEAALMFDLSDVNDTIEKSVESFQQAHAKTEFEIKNAFEDVKAAITHVRNSASNVSEHHGIIAEVTNANMLAIEAAHKKIQWSGSRTCEASTILADESEDQHNDLFRKLLSNDGIQHEDSYDRLEAIKSRGVIRVAIEPDFVGLSFRQSDSAELCGLDVSYANALATHLGVRCEFVEAPWDTLTELLYTGPNAGEHPADIVLSALPPSETYEGVAYSETYTYLNWVLARKVGRTDINTLDDLHEKTLGIINDPGAFELLESLGVRWQANKSVPGGRIFLKDLIAYSDQSRIHDCLAEGLVDVFGVDLPIYHWACTNPASRWQGQLEIFSGNIPESPYYYCVAVAAVPASYKLLHEINTFIKAFEKTSDRAAIEKAWQGEVVSASLSYRDEPGNLIGEQELKHIWEANQRTRRTAHIPNLDQQRTAVY